MNFKELEKQIEKTEYWDMPILDVQTRYFGDEVYILNKQREYVGESVFYLAIKSIMKQMQTGEI
ncbi:MAG: hypothetical protein ACE3JK_09305 [Sporolactobacillus sp.]